MEAFSLLKYWRISASAGVGAAASAGVGAAASAGVGAAASAGVGNAASAENVRPTSTTIVTAVSEHSSESDEEGNDDGPFFDIEFALPNEDDGEGETKDKVNGESDCVEVNHEEKAEDTDSDGLNGEDEREMKLTLSSASSGDSIDQNASLSPSDDLFFKGKLVPIEPSSLVFNSTETDSKSQFPVSLVKSATKFRVLMLKLKKSKTNVLEKSESNGSASGNRKEQQKPEGENKQKQSKLLTVKFNVEEVPFVSVFTRDNSSKVCNSKAQKQNFDESSSEEKQSSKDVMQRYLKKVKPFYVRASKRYNEKLRFSGQLSVAEAGEAVPPSSPPCTSGQIPPPAKLTAATSDSERAEIADTSVPSNAKSERAGNLPAGLRVVYNRLGKSKSASSADACAAATASKRRDDSLLQQQDGIQSAILHCKRSFKASRDSDPSSMSDESQDNV